MCGGFFGGEITDVSQEADAAQRRIQLRKSVDKAAPQFEPRIELLGVFARRTGLEWRPPAFPLTHHFVQTFPTAVAAAAKQTDGFIGGDLRDPGGEAVAIAELIEVREGFQQRLLANVFRIVGVAGNTQGDAEDRGIAGRGERGERIAVAEASPLKKRDIVVCCRNGG